MWIIFFIKICIPIYVRLKKTCLDYIIYMNNRRIYIRYQRHLFFSFTRGRILELCTHGDFCHAIMAANISSCFYISNEPTINRTYFYYERTDRNSFHDFLTLQNPKIYHCAFPEYFSGRNPSFTYINLPLIRALKFFAITDLKKKRTKSRKVSGMILFSNFTPDFLLP